MVRVSSVSRSWSLRLPPDMVMSFNWTIDDFLGYVGTWSAVRTMEKAEGNNVGS